MYVHFRGKKTCKAYFRVSFDSTFKALDTLDCSSFMANSDLEDGCDSFTLAVVDATESPLVSSLMHLLGFSSTFSKFDRKTFCLLLYVMVFSFFLIVEDKKQQQKKHLLWAGFPKKLLIGFAFEAGLVFEVSTYDI